MKYLNYLLLSLMLIGCNTSEDKKQVVQNTKTETSASTSKKVDKTSPQSIELDQNGDYTSLFSRESCEGIITAEEISRVTGNAVLREDAPGCLFEITIPGEEPNNISINSGQMNRSDIAKEIKSFIKNAPILQHVISDTGDTYLCMQATHGRILLYNTNYDGYVLLSYLSAMERVNISKEQKEERQKSGLKIANAILKKHQT